MKILLTGGSSFTGYWFAKALAAAGHELTMTLTRSPEAYEGLRARRVDGLAEFGTFAEGCRFGDETFLSLIRTGSFDALCHHGADVTDYKSEDFDIARALANNTHHAAAVCDAMSDSGCQRLVLTGSYFENEEGGGPPDRPAFSPYGLSKGLTYQVFRYYCARAGLSLGKFVIPNPFGPLEEPRFTGYLAKTWHAGQTPGVRTPDYLRDNIHVDLLAGAYAAFVGSLPAEAGITRINPSGYVESQGAFAQRCAAALDTRLPVDCKVTLERQTEFAEPRVRINTDPATAIVPDWDEAAAWDALAAFYAEQYGSE